MQRRQFVAAVGAALLTAACSERADIAPYGEVIPSKQRRRAPVISGTLLDGKDFTVASLTGKVVTINFWASWCVPCRTEADDLRAVYESSHDRGVDFVGINWRDQIDAANAFADKFKIGYPSIFDPAGKVAMELYDFVPNPQPATLVLDADRMVAAVFIGALVKDDLSTVVEALLRES